MLRLQTDEGWWLVTHPDHARLAGAFADRWGNAQFAQPQPRRQVLRGIHTHDDGWAVRDAQPTVTREGKPAAFSCELVGAYSAFEEIDLQAYLAVRREAVRLMANEDAYAAILISMHTHNLLSARADRSTIRADDLPLLEAFLVEQQVFQADLQEELVQAGSVPNEHLSDAAFERNFRLLQACDNLSLLSCVDYPGDASLLWPQATVDGHEVEVNVEHIGERRFKLAPYPFDADPITFHVPARLVAGTTFSSNEALQQAFAAAKVQELAVVVCA